MRKYTFIGILILMAGLGAACEDQLNALPGQSKVEGNVILDQKTAEVALNGVYYRFADGGDDRGTELSNKLQRWMITNLSVTVKMKLLRKLVG